MYMFSLLYPKTTPPLSQKESQVPSKTVPEQTIIKATCHAATFCAFHVITL